MKKQKIALLAIMLTLLTSALFITPSAFAQSTSNNPKPNFFQGLISFIEQRFGLNKDQVQQAVKDYKTQAKPKITPHPTLTPDQIQAQEKARLDKLVASGKITSAQETLILNELLALRTKYNLNGLTGDQRRTQMQAMQKELQDWAKSQNINIGYLMPSGGIGERGDFRGHFGPKPSGAPQQ